MSSEALPAPEKPAAFLRFNGREGQGKTVDYLGGWPPPERLYLVSGFITDMVTVTTQENLDAAAEKAGGMGVLAEHLNITPYLRRTASHLTDEEAAAVAPNVARCADYDEEV